MKPRPQHDRSSLRLFTVSNYPPRNMLR
jgi:hypothetical protein